MRCSSWSSWGGTLEFCEPYLDHTPNRNPSEQATVGVFAQCLFVLSNSLSSLHGCMHYQLAGASTELSWQISCYIVDRAAEKNIQYLFLGNGFCVSCRRNNSKLYSEAEKQQKNKKTKPNYQQNTNNKKNKLQGGRIQRFGSCIYLVRGSCMPRIIMT